MERKTIEVLRPLEDIEQINLNTEKKRVAAYCRISTLNNHGQMNSLENQMAYYSKYIMNQSDYKLVGIYFDSGLSGTTMAHRPGFRRLIRHCLENRIDVVITKSISRFARNSEDLLETVELLKEHDVTVIFEKEKIDSSKTRNKFFLTVLSAIYQQESVTTSEHIKWGIEKKNKLGKPRFRDQLGYRVIEIDGETTLKVVDEEAELVNRIYELYLEGMSTSKIALLLTKESIKTFAGNEVWNSRTITAILTNTNYIGNRLTNKYVRLLLENKSVRNTGQENQYYIKDTHPSIIDEEVFYKVQQIVETKKKKRKGNITGLALTKRIVCAKCGWIYYHTSHVNNMHRWTCGLRSKNVSLCDAKPIVESQIIQIMIKALDARYNFKASNALKRMKKDIEWVNKNDRFEFHRMRNLSKLLIMKEELEIADNNQYHALKSNIEHMEREIVIFEKLASTIEEDRVYRDKALELLERIKTLEELLKEADVSILRAWIMELVILSEEDFKVRWFDDSTTEHGNFIMYKEKKELSQDRAKKIRAGISVEVENHYTTVSSKPLKRSFKEKPALQRGVEEVEIAKKNHLPTADIIKRIKKQVGENTNNIIKIIPEKIVRKTRIGVYARVSTREPDQLGSLEAQVAYYTYAVLKDPNNELVKIYADEGVSGTNAEKRTSFQKMIKDCETGKIDRIITKSISRFARNTVDAIEYVRKLKECKVSIYFEKEEIDTGDEDGEILLTVYSALAQEESRSLGESISWGRKALAKQGIVRSTVRTYGYELDENWNWCIVEDEAKVIRDIYSRFVSGITASQISRDLTNEGIQTMKKKPSWGAQTINNILRNISYTGDLLYQKKYTNNTITSSMQTNHGEVSQVIIEDHHPHIIDKRTWEMVQKIFEERTKKKPSKVKKHDREEFFLKFKCSECGSPYIHIVNRYKNNERHRWRCHAAYRKNVLIDCDVWYTEEEDIKELFMKMLYECKKDNKFERLINEKINLKKLSVYETERLVCLEDSIKIQYQELYRVVDEGGKNGEDTREIKRHTDSIMETQNQINNIIDKVDEYNFLLKEKKWFMKELENLSNQDILHYRDDIFKRIIIDGVISPNNIITFNLIFGFSRQVNK